MRNSVGDRRVVPIRHERVTAYNSETAKRNVPQEKMRERRMSFKNGKRQRVVNVRRNQTGMRA